MRVSNAFLEDISMLTCISQQGKYLGQATVSPQMQQWLSQSGKEDPWIPLRHVTSSAQHVAADSEMEDNLRDVLKSCTTKNST